MENTPRNWLHNALLTVNFLIANEKGRTAAERHWIMAKSAELNQPIYFKDVLTSQWKPGDVLRWGRGFELVSTGEEILWIPSKFIEVQFEEKKPLGKESFLENNSFTRIIIIPTVRKTYRLGAGFSSCLHRKRLIFKGSKGPWIIEYKTRLRPKEHQQ